MLNDREQFFYDHGGYVQRPGETQTEARIRSALRLAAAELAAENGRYTIDVAEDTEPWDGDEPYDGPLWTVTLHRKCGCCASDYEIASSVSGVACEFGDPYLRVVAAELADDYLSD